MRYQADPIPLLITDLGRQFLHLRWLVFAFRVPFINLSLLNLDCAQQSYIN